MNEKLIKETAQDIKNDYIRGVFLGSSKPEMWTPQTIWNIAQYIVELEEKVIGVSDKR
jgi:hypothetical protein